jgi:hypothetical protein
MPFTYPEQSIFIEISIVGQSGGAFQSIGAINSASLFRISKSTMSPIDIRPLAGPQNITSNE